LENALEQKGLNLEELPKPLRDRYEYLMGEMRTSLAAVKQEADKAPDDESAQQVYEDSLQAYEDMAGDLLDAMDEFIEEKNAAATAATTDGGEPAKEGGEQKPAAKEESDNSIWWVLGAAAAAALTFGAVNLFRNRS